MRLKKITRRNHYDLIYFDFSQVFIYGIFFRSKAMLMAHDVMVQKFSRQGIWLEKIWLKFNEKIIFNRDARILCFSLKDKALIKEIYNRDSFVVPFFLSNQIIDVVIEYSPEDSYFVFYGAWNRKENCDGLRWFFKHLPGLIQYNNFIIIGGGMPTDLSEQIASFSTVKYLGFVSNPYPIIARSKALLAPLQKGAGVKVKVIEALACGTPVIGTGVALEGIDFQFPKALTHCESPTDFFEVIPKFTVTIQEKAEIREAFLNTYKMKQQHLKELIMTLR